MKSSSRFYKVLFGMTAVLALVPASIARTQAPSQPRSRVTIVVGEGLFPGKPVVLLRRAQQVPHDVIVLGARATAEDIFGAIGLLGALRARDGDISPFDIERVPGAYVASADAARRRDIDRFNSVLETIGHTRPTLIDGIGTVKSWEVDVGTRPVLKRQSGG